MKECPTFLFCVVGESKGRETTYGPYTTIGNARRARTQLMNDYWRKIDNSWIIMTTPLEWEFVE